MKRIYTSIDIGSDTIKILVAEMDKGKLNVLAVTSVLSKGIKKGLIIDANELMISLKQALAKIEGKIGVKIDKVIASIPPYYVDYKKVEASVTITNDDQRVSGNDIISVLQTCIYNKLADKEELITILPIEFSIDNKKGIKDPKGLVGKKLIVKAMMITTPKKNVYAIISIIESLGLKVIDLNISPLADYYQFRNKTIDKQVGAIINIGADLTTVSIINRGIVVNSEIITIGGSNIDNDIVYIFKLSKKEGKRLKEKLAIANKQYAETNEIATVINLNKRELKINQYELSEIVMSRLLEILKLAKKQATLLTNKEINYIIITGGITELPGMSSIVTEVFGPKAYLGYIETIGIRENKYSVVSGMIKYFHQKLDLRGKKYSMFNRESEEELTSSYKKGLNINHHSLLSKVFGYFFDN